MKRVVGRLARKIFSPGPGIDHRPQMLCTARGSSVVVQSHELVAYLTQPEPQVTFVTALLREERPWYVGHSRQRPQRVLGQI